MSYEIMDFEKEVIHILTKNHLDLEILEKALSDPAKIEIDYSGWGYHLTISHDLLPEARVTCHEPFVVGENSSDFVGFVVYLMDREITLDVHPLQEDGIGPDFRLSAVQVA